MKSLCCFTFLNVLLRETPLPVKVGAGVVVGLICFFVVIFGMGKVVDGLGERPTNWGKAIMGGVQTTIAVVVALWLLSAGS